MIILQSAFSGDMEGGQVPLILLQILFEDTNNPCQTADVHHDLKYALLRRQHILVWLVVLSTVFYDHYGRRFDRWSLYVVFPG